MIVTGSGAGTQTQSRRGSPCRSAICQIDDCIDGILALMNSDHTEVMNIGSEEMVTINRLAEMIAEHAGKNIFLSHIDGPIGVMGRNSDNTLVKKSLGWSPKVSLTEGLARTYDWIESEVAKLKVTEK